MQNVDFWYIMELMSYLKIKPFYIIHKCNIWRSTESTSDVSTNKPDLSVIELQHFSMNFWNTLIHVLTNVTTNPVVWYTSHIPQFFSFLWPSHPSIYHVLWKHLPSKQEDPSTIEVNTKNLIATYMWTPPAGHEGDLVFISGRLRSASGRLFDGIFNASFQTFFNKIRKEF